MSLLEKDQGIARVAKLRAMQDRAIITGCSRIVARTTPAEAMEVVRESASG